MLLVTMYVMDTVGKTVVNKKEEKIVLEKENRLKTNEPVGDFQLYTDIDDIAHHSCFITPDGNFYRVRESKYEEMPGEYKYRHIDWARQFVHFLPELEKRFIKIKALKEADPEFRRTYTEYDFLIKECGFIAYTNWLERNYKTNQLEEHYGYLPIVNKNTAYTDAQIAALKELKNKNQAIPGIGFLDRIYWSGESAINWYQENLLEEIEKRR